MAELTRAVAYTRFSSDMQREESIEAQMRAIKEFADKQGYALLKNYADRGISGTTDNRPEFQKMLDDAKKDLFDVIIVHKLDRFARNRADSAIYRKELSKNEVKLISVLENFDDRPEAIILQSVIEGYNEYYSKNLRREVMKGLKENALTCRFTGGIPCLGYDIDKETLKYIINPFEAESVKLIFKRYLEGEGYGAIIDELNKKGFKTKRGYSFGKNSLHEILKNEKYTGVYIYNKSVHPDDNGKFNRHLSKSDDEIIKIDGGIPQIISKSDFQKVQEKMKERKKKTATYKAKQDYLLSGKIKCGVCGCTFAGNSRKPRANKPLYVSYNCTKKNGKINCDNFGIKKDFIEEIILEKLADKVFDENKLPEIIEKYNDYALSKNNEFFIREKEIRKKLLETEKGITNIVNIMVSTGSPALVNKLNELEKEKAILESSFTDINRKISQMTINPDKIKTAFRKAKKLLQSGDLKNKKAIVEQYVKQVTIFKEKLIIEFNISEDYSITKEMLFPRR